jgi:hypothetical protein
MPTTTHIKRDDDRMRPGVRVIAGITLLLAAGITAAPARAQQLGCDDGIKTAFHPDAATTVVAVRAIKKGEELMAQDAPKPITAAADMCLVKLLVGPGTTAEKDKTAK